MKTQDKILAVGLKQLNELGVEKVSIRTIADELGISAGNLTYHFKNTDVIIYELYVQLGNFLGEGVIRVQQGDLKLEQLYDLQVHYFGLMWEYRFLFLDFVTIARRNPELRANFNQLMAFRQLQFRAALDRMIQQGLLKEEWMDGLYDRYIIQQMMFSNAWIPDAEIHFDGSPKQKIAFYADLIVSSLTPYLTQEGLAQYQAFRRERSLPPFRGYQTLL